MGQYVDMALTPTERAEEFGTPAVYSGPMPTYPYGLSISFTHEELDKLGLDASCNVGDLLELECIAKVTSVTQSDTTEGVKCRVEMQIIAIAMDDDDAEEDAVPPKKIGPANFYK